MRPPFEMTWLGHSTVRIDLDGVSVLTDPLLVDRLGPLRRYAAPPKPEAWRDVDVVLVSHLHRDHFDFPSLRMLEPKSTLVVPERAGHFARRTGFEDVRELAAGQSTRVRGLTIEATPAVHSGFRVPFGPRAAAIGYVIQGTRRVYVSGDTGPFTGMSDLSERLDVALLSVGGWGPTLRGGHLDARGAAEALLLLRPRVAVPVHYGTFWPIGLRSLRHSRFERPAEEFAKHAARVAPFVQVAVADPGGAVVLPGEPVAAFEAGNSIDRH